MMGYPFHASVRHTARFVEQHYGVYALRTLLCSNAMTTGRALVSQNKCSLCIFFVFVAHTLNSGNI